MTEPLLTVEELKVYFNKKSNLFSRGPKGEIKAVDRISLEIQPNEIHGLVGESGSGKSTLGRAIMGLNPVTGGEIRFKGRNIMDKSYRSDPKERLKIQMIFQDPNSSLNPNMKIKEILAEPILINRILPKREIPDRLAELMDTVDLPEKFLERYPHQLSGGQRQRIAVARALATKPELIVADEPTSALDVSVQAQLLNLLMDLKRIEGLSILFISHNLSVVRYISDRISVMQQGEVLETGTAEELFSRPNHPYTKKLISTIPQIDQPKKMRMTI